MKLTFEIEYFAQDNETIWLVGSEIFKEGIAFARVGHQYWSATIDVQSNIEYISYKYYVKHENTILREELGEAHIIPYCEGGEILIKDMWKDEDAYQYIYSSAFTNSFSAKKNNTSYSEKIKERSTILQVIQPYIFGNEEIRIVGDCEYLGNWDINKAPKLKKISDDTWQIYLDKELLDKETYFKFVIVDYQKDSQVWEDGKNRIYTPNIDTKGNNLQLFRFRSNPRQWKTSGIAIPIFSLRSTVSFGIGDFLDLKKLIDWCVESKQKIIQILPINDTSISKTWKDSYPYNAISVFALHPIYLGLSDLEIKDELIHEKLLHEAKELNELDAVNYEKALDLKARYIDVLYQQEKKSILASPNFLDFYAKNENWLYPYAVFCYLRDKHQTANFSCWGDNAQYNAETLKNSLSVDPETKHQLDKTYFTQYLLHKQLLEVRKYANTKGVILKGDIPIGISRDSVEAWMYPDLFHLDKQTGAPPDDFAKDGQNWGFPTYNWNKMAEDSYHWWKTRFQKMAEYFDAYRIDHILGFFRIWEIPDTSIHGLLGQFNPALPFSKDEILSYGFSLDIEKYSSAFILKEDLIQLCQNHYKKIADIYLNDIDGKGTYSLKSPFKNQRLIQDYFEKLDLSIENKQIKHILFQICNEVLFLEDNTIKDKYHPRIELHRTFLYSHLDNDQKEAIDRLYQHFFYHRHNEYWKTEAMKKLPCLIHATNMLVCGEDLGMIPSCVPQVMSDLQILSLEIERMPKLLGERYANLSNLSYLSVCSTSTHDMSPIRLWWDENRENAQYYYNHVLHQQGEAPNECSTEIAHLIIKHHLMATSMLTIFPLQDLLAMNQELRNPSPEAERINIPADSNHYWKYRMHLTIEQLIENKDFSYEIQNLMEKSNRD